MSIAVKLRRAPGRLVTGAFILNSGLGKLRGDQAQAERIHTTASGAYPFLGSIEPKTFLTVLGASEVTIGAALLLPVVPTVLAAGALAGFSGGLLGLYWRTPGMHGRHDPRPTPAGLAISKDVWMAGIAAGLLADALLPDRRARRAEKRAARAEQRADAAVDAGVDSAQ